MKIFNFFIKMGKSIHYYRKNYRKTISDTSSTAHKQRHGRSAVGTAHIIEMSIPRGMVNVANGYLNSKRLVKPVMSNTCFRLLFIPLI